MQQFWVPASKALFLVARESGDHPANLAICERAHAGVLKSKAKLYIGPNQRAEDAPIPAEFWWAEGHEALEQDWSRGDFSTWIDDSYQLKAFGVDFDFIGIREMLTPQCAAAAARELSVVGNPQWISAKEARTFLWDRLKLNPTSAGPSLIDYCKLGFVPARAALMQRSGKGGTLWGLEVREWDVPLWFWDNLTGESGSQDWERGLFSGHGRTPEGLFTIALTGVHFEAAALEALLPEKPGSQRESSPTRGGRPRKEWWDDLWCAIWGQIVHGELTPTSQAEIERAMLNWVEQRGESVAESTVKPLAKKVWLEWNREAKN